MNGPDKKALVAQLAAARDISTPERAAASIRAWHDALALLGTIAELQVMEALAVIRRHLPERDRFDAFCAEHLDGVFGPGDAWNRALTWEVSGRQRALKEFASTSPAEATAFVRDFAEALGPARIDDLDEDDREVAEILAAPPRTRRQRMRELVATRRAVTSTSTDPGELQLVPPPPDRPALPQAGAVRASLERSVRAQAETAKQIEQLCAAPGALSPTARSRLLLLIDHGFDALEKMSAALHGNTSGEEDG